MTMALCMNCGDIKWGAWCPCPNCRVASSGDQNLDIAFSDHCVSVEQLDLLGDIVRQIATHCDDSDLRFAAFLKYVERHPISQDDSRRLQYGKISFNLNASAVEKVDAILDKLAPPRPGTGPKRVYARKPMSRKFIVCMLIWILLTLALLIWRFL